jgi:hypothetical protein
MQSSKIVPRFVPTLTEVVQPGQPHTVTAIDTEWLAEQVLQTIKPKLEQQLRASLQVLIEQQMRAMAPTLQQEMEDAIRVAVAQTLARIIKTKK